LKSAWTLATDLLLVVVGGINPNCVCSELVQQSSCVCSAIGCFLACWSHSLALLLIYLWAPKFALFFLFFFFFSLALMLENSDQEVNNDPVHLQVQFLINLVLRTGTKTNLSSPISSKPIELCYAKKEGISIL